MQEKTIINALLALRKQIIRDGSEGQEHIEALLRMRGVRLPRVLPAKPVNSARQGEMAKLILDALRERPMRRCEMIEHLAAKRSDIPRERLYWRMDSAMNKLRIRGKIAREGRMWGLAP